MRFEPQRVRLVDSWLTDIRKPAVPRLSLRLIAGEGGTGKTRSALELLSRAKHAEQDGWTGWWLPVKLPSDALDQWRELVTAHPGRYILVIDYAEGRQGDLLMWLQVVYDVLRTSAVSGDELQVHVFCLARNADWWQQLSRHPDCSEDIKNLLFGPANLGVAAMPPLDANADERTLAYRHALEDYASAQGLPVPANAWQPKLEGVPYERALYIHLAALAALVGERPAHAQSLLRTQIDREFQYWQKTSAKDGSAPVTYMDWADITAWVALSQGAPFSALKPAMSALQIESPGLATALSQTTAQRSMTCRPCNLICWQNT